MTEITEKIKELAKLWAKWNRGELQGDDFVYRFYQLFQDECRVEWDNYLLEADRGKEQSHRGKPS